jgi:hypothetical protein
MNYLLLGLRTPKNSILNIFLHIISTSLTRAPSRMMFDDHFDNFWKGFFLDSLVKQRSGSILHPDWGTRILYLVCPRTANSRTFPWHTVMAVPLPSLVWHALRIVWGVWAADKSTAYDKLCRSPSGEEQAAVPKRVRNRKWSNRTESRTWGLSASFWITQKARLVTSETQSN